MKHGWKSGLAMAGLAALCLAISPGIGGAEGTKDKKADQAGVSCVAPAKGPLAAAGTPGSGAIAGGGGQGGQGPGGAAGPGF